MNADEARAWRQFAIEYIHYRLFGLLLNVFAQNSLKWSCTWLHAVQLQPHGCKTHG